MASTTATSPCRPTRFLGGPGEAESLHHMMKRVSWVNDCGGTPTLLTQGREIPCQTKTLSSFLKGPQDDPLHPASKGPGAVPPVTPSTQRSTWQAKGCGEKGEGREDRARQTEICGLELEDCRLRARHLLLSWGEMRRR